MNYYSLAVIRFVVFKLFIFPMNSGEKNVTNGSFSTEIEIKMSTPVSKDWASSVCVALPRLYIKYRGHMPHYICMYVGLIESTRAIFVMIRSFITEILLSSR